jgi:hypothetical protein
MGYTYPTDPKAMFEDRFEQFITMGIPRTDVEEGAALLPICGPTHPAVGSTNGLGSHDVMRNLTNSTRLRSVMAAQNFLVLRMRREAKRWQIR